MCTYPSLHFLSILLSGQPEKKSQQFESLIFVDYDRSGRDYMICLYFIIPDEFVCLIFLGKILGCSHTIYSLLLLLLLLLLLVVVVVVVVYSFESFSHQH